MIDYLFDTVMEHAEPVKTGYWFRGLWGEMMLILYEEYGVSGE